MGSVLFFAYHFPPVGGAGVQRPARFVRYLPDHGYRPIVVTGPGVALGRWTPEDETLVAEIPPETEVHRVPGPEPPQEGRGEQLERWLRQPSSWSRWWVDGASAAGRAVAAGAGADLVYTWMQPYQTAEVGARVARALGKPWVADLGDPWAFDEMIAYPTGVHRWLERRKMRSLLGDASAVVMSTPEAARRLVQAFPEFSSKTVVAIGNGYDPRDFEAPVTPRSDGRFRIVHTGYLHTNLGLRYRRLGRLRRLLGGLVPGVDVLPRSHVFLLEAVDQLVARRPDLRGRLEICLAGVLSPEDQEVAARYDTVVAPGYVSHREAVALMQTGDLLFLPLHDLPVGVRATIVPGKAYEYLAAGTPILAALPDGDARDLLAQIESAKICRPTDISCLSTRIEEEIDRPTPRPDVRSPVIERFSYASLAEELAGVFDRVLHQP